MVTNGPAVTRQCEFDAVGAGQYPRMLRNLNLGVLEADNITIGSPVPILRTQFDMVTNLCGCTTTPTGVTDWTTLCRALGSTDCVVCSSTTPYKCGSVISIPETAITGSPYPLSLPRLCYGCPPNEVGQCATVSGDKTLKHCASYVAATGECPSAGSDGLPYYFCHDQLGQAYRPGIPAVGTAFPVTSTIHGLAATSKIPLGDWMYYDNANNFGFWYQLANIRTMWGVGTDAWAFDGANCVPVAPGHVLEQPK